MLCAKQVARVIVAQARGTTESCRSPSHSLLHEFLDCQIEPHGALVDADLFRQLCRKAAGCAARASSNSSPGNLFAPCVSARWYRGSRCRCRTSSSIGEGSAAPQVCPMPRPPNVPMVDMLSQLLHGAARQKLAILINVGRVVGRAVDELVRDADFQQRRRASPARRPAASPASRDASRSARPCRSWRSRASRRPDAPPRPRCRRRAQPSPLADRLFIFRKAVIASFFDATTTSCRTTFNPAAEGPAPSAQPGPRR